MAESTKHLHCREIQKFIEIAIDATLVTNELGIITHTNSRAEKLLGYSRNELIGQAVEVLVPDAARINHSSLRTSFVKKPEIREMGKYVDLNAKAKSGQEIPVSVGLSPFFDENGHSFILVSLRDNSLLHESRARIDDYISELRNITETAIDGIVTMNEGSEILSWNDAATQLFGYTAEEAIGQLISIIIPKELRDGHFSGVNRVTNGEQSKIVGKTVEISALHKSGVTVPISLSISTWESKQGRVFCGILRDISARIEAEKKITEQNEQLKLIAITDPLTGAYNRRQLDLVAGKEFARSTRSKQPYTTLMLDIDHFKSINDNYGHAVGDGVLVATVKTLKQLIREGDSLFRMGGEEFAILLPETNEKSAYNLAERLRDSISHFQLSTEQGTITYTISIGLAECSAEDKSMDDTIKRADEAVYNAKSLGRNRVEIAKTECN